MHLFNYKHPSYVFLYHRFVSFYLSKSSVRPSDLNVAIEKGTIVAIQSGYSQDTGRIQSGYSQDTGRVQSGYREDTVRIQSGYRADTVRIQGEYSQDTGRIQSGYSGVVVVLVSVTTRYCSIVYLHYQTCLNLYK